MSLEHQPHRIEKATLGYLLKQISNLHSAPKASVTAEHHDLGPDLWMSCDPGGRAVMTCEAAEAGFRLELEAADSGQWAALGMRLPVDALKPGLYIGLLLEGHFESIVSFTPCLRYFRPDGKQDVPTPTPVVLASGQRTSLSYIPLDPDLLNAATSCEFNIFFNSDRFVATISKAELLLMS